jgi:HNH endonuclease
MTKEQILGVTEIKKASDLVPDECHLWQGWKDRDGYGWTKWEGRRWAVHRLTWTWANGPIPSGKESHHLCRVRNCCNPAHVTMVTDLEHGTADGNRGVKTGANLKARKACGRGHIYRKGSWKKVLDSSGYESRLCLVCLRMAKANYKAKNADAIKAKDRETKRLLALDPAYRESKRKYAAEYRAKNRAICQERERLYDEEHREKRRQYAEDYRARKKAVETPLPPA